MTLILDIPARIGLERASLRRGADRADRFEGEEIGFHEVLRRAFLDIAAAEPARCAVIDALKPEDEVEAAIWVAVEARLDPAGSAGRRR